MCFFFCSSTELVGGEGLLLVVRASRKGLFRGLKHAYVRNCCTQVEFYLRFRRRASEFFLASLILVPHCQTHCHRICSAGAARQMSGVGHSNLIDRSPSFSDSQDDSDECVQESWIEWWTHLKGNEFLCEVSEEFLRDEFNLYGFSAQVDAHSVTSALFFCFF